MINFSAALSTWPPSSSPLLNGKGESVIFSSLTIGLFPNRDKAGDAVACCLKNFAKKDMIEKSSTYGAASIVPSANWCETIIAPFTAEEKSTKGDAKSLLQAIKKMFGGNAATKKTQKNHLKQQYENFTASSSEVECYNLPQNGDTFAREVQGLPRNLEKRNRENTRSDSSRRKVQLTLTHGLLFYTVHNSEIVDKCKTGLGYNPVPPPYIGNFVPPKPDLSFFSLEEFVNEPIVNEPTVMKSVIETSEPKASADKPKAVKKNNGALIIEDWVSDSEKEDMPQAKIQKKTVKPSFAKIEFVKSKEQVKTHRKTTVKHGNQNRQNTHSPRGNQRN
ncbi:hypothetical protein Tco_1216563 [Tanacetum coccineum]